ncbi:MAG: hypothetical protein ACOZQL_04225 [Myxococcota bacterium]
MLREARVALEPGRSPAELSSVETRFGLSFPPDLRELLSLPHCAGWPNWRTPDETLAYQVAWPVEGLLFDVEDNALWLPRSR